MALRKRTQRIKVGVPEGVLLLLLVATLGYGSYWLTVNVSPRWIEVPAFVSSISLAAQEAGPGAAAPGDARFQVAFTYVANGRSYQGVTQPGVVQRTLFRALPPEVKELLKRRGFVRFSDLPAPIREKLESKGVMGFDRIPEHLVEDMHARGYFSEKDLPAGVRAALRSGDPKRIAAAIDELVPDVPQDQESGAAQPLAPASAEAGGRTVTRVERLPAMEGGITRGDALLSVWFKVANPNDYRVSYLPGIWQYVRLAVLVAMAAATLGYVGVVYPRIKKAY